MSFGRREFLRRAGGLAAAATAVSLGGGGANAWALDPKAQPLARAAIPSSGREIARIGLGTWQTFDVAAEDSAAQVELGNVLRELVEAGAELVDTSPMYGRSETVLGELLARHELREKVFLATKVWTTGGAAGGTQMKESLTKLQAAQVELMQVHNLVDWRTHLETLRRWRDEQRVRYIGLTHYTESALPELTRIIREERVDFVQFALSLDEPAAAGDFLKLCADRGVAFLANRPLGGGGALRKVRERPLPEFAPKWGITSWAQLLLKWVLSHPEVTCAIPGTSKVAHLRDNLGAARGVMPDADGRKRLAEAWAAVSR